MNSSLEHRAHPDGPNRSAEDSRISAIISLGPVGTDSFLGERPGHPYGWLTILNLGLCLLTGAKFSFGIDGQQICSALVAWCLERIGEIFPEAEPWYIMPADLAKHFDVRLTRDKGEPPNPDYGVIHFSKPGRRRNYLDWHLKPS